MIDIRRAAAERSRKHRLASVLGVWLVLGSAAGAAAQPSGLDAEQQGRAKFDSAREMLKQGDTKAAADLFRASLALNRAAGTLLNLAHCEEKLGLFASASTHYQEALGRLPETDERAVIAKERMVAIEPRIPTLRIHLEEGAPSATTVLLGERDMKGQPFDTDIRLDPGRYALTASAAGHTSRRYEVNLDEGETKTIVVSPILATSDMGAPPIATASVAPVSARAVSPSPLRTAGYVTAGVAAAALVAGFVTGGLAFAKRQDLDEKCPGRGPRECDSALQPDHASGRALADASTVMFVVAGATFVGGGVMLLGSMRGDGSAPRIKVALGPGTLSALVRF